MLACLGIVLSTVAVWTHQVALKTEQFTPLVTTVVTDPAVTDPVSARISAQVVDALGVGTRLEARLPDALKPLAGTLTVAVRNAIDDRLKIALQDPRLQTALVNALAFTHEHVVRLLRDESEVIGVVDGYVTMDVFPVVGAALAQLQTMGLIPADVVLPDLSDPEAPDVLAQRLESVLNVDLPPTFGTIQLMPADRLVAAQSVIRIFDVVVILLIVLTALLVAASLWLAQDRRRMLMYLGIGTIIAFLIARTVIRSAAGAIVGGIADPGVAGAAQTIVDAVLEDLRGLTIIIVIITVILTIAAYLSGRPKWATTTASAVGDRAGRAGSAASTAAASYSLSDVTAKAPRPDLRSKRRSARTAPPSSGSVLGRSCSSSSGSRSAWRSRCSAPRSSSGSRSCSMRSRSRPTLRTLTGHPRPRR